MTFEEQVILMFRELNEKIDTMATDIKELKDNQATMTTDIKELQDSQAKTNIRLGRMENDIQDIKTLQIKDSRKLSALEVNLEDIEADLRIIAEGHKNIVKAMSRLEKRPDYADDISIMKTLLSSNVDEINKLKMAK